MFENESRHVVMVAYLCCVADHGKHVRLDIIYVNFKNGRWETLRRLFLKLPGVRG